MSIDDFYMNAANFIKYPSNSALFIFYAKLLRDSVVAPINYVAINKMFNHIITQHDKIAILVLNAYHLENKNRRETILQI